DRASEILKRLESKQSTEDHKQKLAVSRPNSMQLTLFEIADHPFIDQIRQLEVEHLTPMKALELLNQWKQELDFEKVNAR
ncbi:MAG: hypothetical protein AAGA30_13320, partial [Planctomycetota bacterium]